MGDSARWTTYDGKGQRKYLTQAERKAFLRAAKLREPDIYIFCWLLTVTGCRISEALALTKESFDFEAGCVIVKCLKKRSKLVFRAIPLPPPLLDAVRDMTRASGPSDGRLWPWSRMTGFRRVCEVMRSAQIEGKHATPRGLRHGFGVSAVQANVPLNLVQRWLGHADIKTTTIYTEATGPEEREFASRFWVVGGRVAQPGRRGHPGIDPMPPALGKRVRSAPVRHECMHRPRNPSNRSVALLKLANLINYRVARTINTSASEDHPVDG